MDGMCVMFNSIVWCVCVDAGRRMQNMYDMVHQWKVHQCWYCMVATGAWWWCLWVSF